MVHDSKWKSEEFEIGEKVERREKEPTTEIQCEI